jgi:hypothetical protein
MRAYGTVEEKSMRYYPPCYIKAKCLVPAALAGTRKIFIKYRAVWGTEPFFILWSTEKSLASSRNLTAFSLLSRP